MSPSVYTYKFRRHFRSTSTVDAKRARLGRTPSANPRPGPPPTVARMFGPQQSRSRAVEEEASVPNDTCPQLAHNLIPAPGHRVAHRPVPPAVLRCGMPGPLFDVYR